MTLWTLINRYPVLFLVGVYTAVGIALFIHLYLTGRGGKDGR